MTASAPDRLWHALQEWNLAEAHQALDDGVDVNAPNSLGQSPLAFWLRHPKIGRAMWDSQVWLTHQAIEARLLKQGASVMIANPTGTSLLIEGLTRHVEGWVAMGVVGGPDHVEAAMVQWSPWLRRAQAEQAPETWGPDVCRVWMTFVQQHGRAHDHLREQGAPERWGRKAGLLAQASLHLLLSQGVPVRLFDQAPISPEDRADIAPLLVAHHRLQQAREVTVPGLRRRRRLL
jgi:hypothetical protein